MPAQRCALSGGRWHFQHGPMDIVIGADGDSAAVAEAHERAWLRFVPLLDELVSELPVLQLPVQAGRCPLRGSVARRMWQACVPYSAGFMTPMAAVAGAVAQTLAACYAVPGVARAWVNNGGDIALHLPQQDAAVRIGLYVDLARLQPQEVEEGLLLDGQFEVTHAMPVRGVATSGWRGRSFSLGIADSVTVLAATAAQADAAASSIANAVNVVDARIVRRPACEIRDNSDLGQIPVTVDVPPLGLHLVRQALEAGARQARALQDRGLVWSAALFCQGQRMVVSAHADVGSHTTASALPDPAVFEVGSVFA